MGALRNTLKVLFNEQNVEDVIKQLVGPSSFRNQPNNYKIAKIDEGFYKAAYTHIKSNFTEDQAGAAFHISEDKWKEKPKEKNDHFAFCPYNSIFNTLLHFSTQVLLERNDKPICKFEHLLKWHEVTYLLGEDLFTTSFLASKDIKTGFNRKVFSWPTVIDHDCALLHQLYAKDMADIHNHLAGNGYISELSWLSLMNDVNGRRGQFTSKEFRISKALHTFYGTEDEYTSLYSKVIKAAAIRLHLFEVALAACHNPCCKPQPNRSLFDCAKLCRLLHEPSSVGVDMYLCDISSGIATAHRMYGKRYQTRTKDYSFVDYALLNRPDFQRNNMYRDIDFVLSGERWLLYTLFHMIYRGEDKGNKLSSLLYIYLLIKNELQNELVQTNINVGFGNFQDYENRKWVFLKNQSVYAWLLTQTAIRSIINHDDRKHRFRYLETRIAPKDTCQMTVSLINYYDKSADYINLSNDKCLIVPDGQDDRWHYVAHFLKKADNADLKVPLQNPRNWNVRKPVRNQCQAIDEMRCNIYDAAKRLVGIDAASSELCCRPEVFAQGFRFLRQSKHHYDIYNKMLPDLGVTYHVGEDFNDIIDGLRAVKEAMMFLEMRNGDRIGHGLVLGTDVEKYYRKRDRAVPMSKQCILDNMAFMLVEGSTVEGFHLIRTAMERHYERLLRYIYGDKLRILQNPSCPNNLNVHISPYTYYQSWLLRGDDPESYQLPKEKPMDNQMKLTQWQRCSLVPGQLFEDARDNYEARYLYHLYHYNKDVKKRGNEYEQLEYPKEAFPVIARIQEKILTEVEANGISIECNPTSNYKIGEMERFIEHPVSRFNMITRPKQGQMHYMSVSINTDDKGVFSTSLEREFALIAAAYDKEFKHDPENSPTPREVYDWLDNIREMAFEMAFDFV